MAGVAIGALALSPSDCAAQGYGARGYGGQPSVVVDTGVLDALGGPPVSAPAPIPGSATPYGYGYVPGAPPARAARGGKLPPIINPGVIPGGFDALTPQTMGSPLAPAAPTPIIPLAPAAAPSPIIPDVPVQAPLFAGLPGYESPLGAPGGLVFQPPRGGPDPVLRGAAAGYGSPTPSTRGAIRPSTAALPPADGSPAVFRSTGTYATARRAPEPAAPAMSETEPAARADTPRRGAESGGAAEAREPMQTASRSEAGSMPALTPPPPPPPLTGGESPAAASPPPASRPTLAAPRVEPPKVEPPKVEPPKVDVPVPTPSEAAGSKPTVAAPATPLPPAATAPAASSPAPPADKPAPVVPPPAATPPAAPAPAAPTQVATATPAESSAVPGGTSMPTREAPLQLLFPPDASTLSDEARGQLDTLAKKLGDDANERVQLRAYAAGDADSASQTRRLSLARALAVRSYLIKQGVRGMRVDVRALGNTYQSGPGDRVDVLVLDQ